MPSSMIALLLIAGSLSPSMGQEIQRESYSVQVPKGVVIDPQDADVDLDHLTCVNITESSSLTISVTDKIKTGANLEKKMVDGMLGNMKGSVKMKDLAVAGTKPESVGSWSGKINGIGYHLHVCKYTKAINEKEEKNVVFMYLIMASESEKLSGAIGDIAKSISIK